jgi:ABC-type sugar transport system ATPase subunit
MNSGPIIETRDLRKTYQVGKVDVPALRGVDLTVKPGEFVAIVGPSGSGKSTLFHIIGGLTPPTSGEVRVAGQDLAAMTEAGRTRLRKRSVAFVFQKFNLLPNLTARDNIAIARYIGGFGFEAGGVVRGGPPAARHRQPAGPQTERVVRRRATARGHRPRDCEPPRHSAGRRAHRQSR